jgi:predicted nucleotide-binding protein (sugar kinase/HSP70/actin superfamily)
MVSKAKVLRNSKIPPFRATMFQAVGLKVILSSDISKDVFDKSKTPFSESILTRL